MQCLIVFRGLSSDISNMDDIADFYDMYDILDDLELEEALNRENGMVMHWCICSSFAHPYPYLYP